MRILSRACLLEIGNQLNNPGEEDEGMMRKHLAWENQYIVVSIIVIRN